MTDATTTCPGCGLVLPDQGDAPDQRYNASGACRALYTALTVVTLADPGADFIHQLAVDAYASQHVSAAARPIGTAFALVGLYLAFERGFTGRQVQRAHTLMAQRRRDWPRFTPPVSPMWLTVWDVLAAPDEQRRAALRAWGESVWAAWREQHGAIAALATATLG
ncbi:MAG: DUF5946 family protein [Thermomicrobiales bacterium]